LLSELVEFAFQSPRCPTGQRPSKLAEYQRRLRALESIAHHHKHIPMLKFPDFQLEIFPGWPPRSAICGGEQTRKSIAHRTRLNSAGPGILVRADTCTAARKARWISLACIPDTLESAASNSTPMAQPAYIRRESRRAFFIHQFPQFWLQQRDDGRKRGATMRWRKRKDHGNGRGSSTSKQIVRRGRGAAAGRKISREAQNGSRDRSGAPYDNGHTVVALWKPTLARVLATLDCFDMVLVDEAQLCRRITPICDWRAQRLNPAIVFTAANQESRGDVFLPEWDRATSAGRVPTSYAAPPRRREELPTTTATRSIP